MASDPFPKLGSDAMNGNGDRATLIDELKKLLAALSDFQNDARRTAAQIGMTPQESKDYELRTKMLDLQTEESKSNAFPTLQGEVPTSEGAPPDAN
jgi:hypothetical protein